MLVELKVSQFAIIDQIDIHFQNGLNVLSGETGAGKSVLLKSLSLLMGEKSSTDVVRSGVEQASLEGFFDLSERPDIIERVQEMGIEVLDDTLIVRRIISQGGKSRVYLNGALSPLTALRDLIAPLITLTSRTAESAPLIEMTGQHDNRHLQSKSYHLDLLDQYSGALEERAKYQTLYSERQDLLQEMETLQEESKSREQQLDFLKYQIAEIEALGLKSEEDQELENKVKRLKGGQKLQDFYNQAIESLYASDDAALVRVQQLLQRSAELKNTDQSLENLHLLLGQAKAILEEATLEVRNSSRSLESEGENLEELESRLSDLRRMQKKFGNSVEDILKSHDNMTKEVQRLEGSDDRLKELSKKVGQLGKELMKLAEGLHTRRSKTSSLLKDSVNDELSDLNMKGVIFEVSVGKLDELGANGISDVEFLIRQSKKDDAKSIAKVASGGELSRILLALKTVVGMSESPRTYLFDEVDTGVSGQTAEKVGRKLKEIAKGQQVICVTHLPQVAAFADHHYLIEKGQTKGRASMKVIPLQKEERVQEIARLISGEKITKTSLDHARELLGV